MGTAWAMSGNQASGGTANGGSAMLSMMPMLIVIFAVMYFLIIRPQQKKQKEAAKMLSDLKKGDRVSTVGGMLGSVVGIKDDIVTLKIADNTKVEFRKSSIGAVLQKGDGVAE